MTSGSRHSEGTHTRRNVLIGSAVFAAVVGAVAALTLGQSAPGAENASGGQTPKVCSTNSATSPCAAASGGAAVPSATATTAGPTTPPKTATPAPTPAGPCASATACGFPGPADTGPGKTAQVAHSGNLEVRTNGETIDGWDLHGSLDIYANNVTVIDSSITSTTWWGINLRPGYTGLRILHSMLTGTPGAGPDNGGEDYAVSDMGAGTIEVGWDDISVFGDTLSMGNGYIHDDYVHGIVPFINRSGTYEHLDAVISDGDDKLGLVIRHNTILNPVNYTQGPTSAIGLLPNTGPVYDTTVQDNWIAGGAFALYGGGKGASNIVVTGNVFSTQYWNQCGYYGPVAYWNTGGSGNVWSDNTYSSGAPVNEPTGS